MVEVRIIKTLNGLIRITKFYYVRYDDHTASVMNNATMSEMVVPSGGKDFDMENPTRANKAGKSDPEGQSGTDQPARLALWAKLGP